VAGDHRQATSDKQPNMKKAIVYSSHLQLRMKIREIDSDLPREIYQKGKEKYFDTKTGYKIVIGEAHYRNKFREMVLVYEETIDEIIIITIYPLKSYEKISKIKSGRWQKR